MRVVQCHGCFDLLHVGHLRHLEAAKRAGDKLVVTVTPDAYVKKGPGRPVFSAELRAEMLAALRCVDEVQITAQPTAAEAIRQIRPAVFAKGLDYTDENLDLGELAALKDVGGELLITETEKWSSTALLQQAGLTSAADAYLADLRRRYRPADVRLWLEKARALKVLVIGDAIRDEYHYVDTLGKSGKDPILAVQLKKTETYRGGAEAVREHASACSDDVCLVIGDLTVKRRYVEQYPFQKLFEVYDTVECTGTPWDETDVADLDLVIVADYGHGMMTPKAIDVVTTHAKFLAVNTQANAGNHGFNTISKYPRADFISISERELRLDARDQRTDTFRLMRKASESRGATVLVTRGVKGCRVLKATTGCDAPALTTHAVDRTGAGDAVFAVTACCAAVGMPLDLLCFMASVVGTQAVGIVGNARYIERESLWAAIEQYLA